MPLFDDGDLSPNPFKIYPNTTAGGGHEQVALWLAAQAQPPGPVLWNLAVRQAYTSNDEIELEIARETLRRKERGLLADELTVKKALILRSGIVKPNKQEIIDSLGINLKPDEE